MIVAQIGGVFGPVLIYMGGFVMVILGYLGRIWWVGIVKGPNLPPEEGEKGW